MNTQEHNLGKSLVSGLAGAVALTAVHETARRVLPNAPRMDTVGRRALVRGAKKLGLEPPAPEKRQPIALAGELVSNTLYYTMVGLGRKPSPLLRGGVLGTLAGVGAVALPPLLGLGRKARGTSADTQAMTTGWYLIGGLVAAATYRLLDRRW